MTPVVCLYHHTKALFLERFALSFKTTWNFLKRKAIAHSAYFTTSKTKETSRCRRGLGTTTGLQVPGRGFSWHSPSICPTAAGPLAAHMQLAWDLKSNSRDLARRRYLVVNRWHSALLYLFWFQQFLSSEKTYLWDHVKWDHLGSFQSWLPQGPGTAFWLPPPPYADPLHCENTSRQINCPGNEMVSDSQIPCIARIKLCISQEESSLCLYHY